MTPKPFISSHHELTPSEMGSERHCAVCGATQSIPLLVIDAPDRFERAAGVEAHGYRRIWVECARCGVAANILPEESIGKLTSLRDAYYEIDLGRGGVRQKFDTIMSLPQSASDNAGRVQRVLTAVKRWLPPDAPRRLLDIGTGTGVFPALFGRSVEEPWDIVALEPDPIAAAHLREIGGFAVVEEKYVGQQQLSDFTLVTLNKVLEHLPDPATQLASMKGALHMAGALIYVEVPDKLTARFRPPEDNILGSMHCHLYDPSSLMRLFTDTGLFPLSVERLVEPSGKITVWGIATPDTARLLTIARGKLIP